MTRLIVSTQDSVKNKIGKASRVEQDPRVMNGKSKSRMSPFSVVDDPAEETRESVCWRSPPMRVCRCQVGA